MRFGIVVFPGSNCDHDAFWGIKHELGFPVNFLWHRQMDLEGSDCIVLPGGFAHGDYLRGGAIARFSPVMDAVLDHARKGRPVVGICNGFQVLLEIGLLPGALLRNDSLRFCNKPINLRVERAQSSFTSGYNVGEVLELPIAHGQGKYYADSDTLEELDSANRILFRYCSPGGEFGVEWNPNGSLRDIAGICNAEGNVLGMMPHPERYMNERLGGIDGKPLFLAIAEAFS